MNEENHHNYAGAKQMIVVMITAVRCVKASLNCPNLPLCTYLCLLIVDAILDVLTTFRNYDILVNNAGINNEKNMSLTIDINLVWKKRI